MRPMTALSPLAPTKGAAEISAYAVVRSSCRTGRSGWRDPATRARLMQAAARHSRTDPDQWNGTGKEPAVEELLADPLLHLILLRDGLACDSVRAAVAEARENMSRSRRAD